MPEAVSEWTRNIVANRLSNNGSQWSTLFGEFNSGTYNNQFMVRYESILLVTSAS